MNYQGFKKLIEQNKKCASIKETRYYRISAVWIGNVKINFTEVKIDKDDWLLEKIIGVRWNERRFKYV